MCRNGAMSLNYVVKEVLKVFLRHRMCVSAGDIASRKRTASARPWHFACTESCRVVYAFLNNTVSKVVTMSSGMFPS